MKKHLTPRTPRTVRTVLVTGGVGFIGSHLVDKLIEAGNKVFVIDDLSSGRIENLNPRAKFYKADVASKDISKIFERVKPQVVFHLAAKSIVGDIFENPLEALKVNILGTANILEQCRLKRNLESIVVASSDKAYGKIKELPYKEETPLSGDHPYEVSKASADLVAQSYYKTYGLPVVITRFSNVFGPRDLHFSRIIPGIFEAIIKNKKLLVRSDGKMIREYTFVKDIADGCIKLAQNINKTKGEAFNFGSKNIFTVLGVIKKVEEILGVKVNYKILNTAKNEIPKQYLDWSKAKNRLGWRPKYSFEEAIKESFEWYKKHL
jgi:CDP-glucose 4,6-dehydratase